LWDFDPEEMSCICRTRRRSHSCVMSGNVGRRPISHRRFRHPGRGTGHCGVMVRAASGRLVNTGLPLCAIRWPSRKIAGTRTLLSRNFPHRVSVTVDAWWSTGSISGVAGRMRYGWGGVSHPYKSGGQDRTYRHAPGCVLRRASTGATTRPVHPARQPDPVRKYAFRRTGFRLPVRWSCCACAGA